MTQRSILFALLSLSLVSCIETECPTGTVEFDGRCVEALPDGGPDGDSTDCAATCAGSTPICDTDTGVCVGCLLSSDCTGSASICDAVTHSCVVCASDTDCSGATPACSPTTKTCVPCAEDKHCPESAPACNAQTATCVTCTGDQHCEGATPACNTSTATCVACTNDTHCAASGKVCDEPTATCVGCTSSADCTSAAAPACEIGSHTCRGCQADAECAGLAATPVCDETSGSCVACTSDTEAARCGSFSCSQLTNTCTTTLRLSVSRGYPCTASSECIGASACVYHPQTGVQPLVCLPLQGAGCETNASTRPFAKSFSAVAADGSTVAACRPQVAFIDSYVSYDMNRACASDTTCGAFGGTCRNGHCTIFCTSDYGCSTSHVCTSSRCQAP